MDLTQLANLGEFIGGVAVLATLVYLALQVRQSNEHAVQAASMERSQTNRDVSRYWSDLMAATRDREFMELVQRGSADFSGLSRVDQGRIASWIGSLHLQAISTFLAAGSGLIDEDFAEAWIDNYVSHLKAPGLQQWWQATRTTHHPDFVRYIEERIEAEDGPPAVHEVYEWYRPDDTATEAD